MNTMLPMPWDMPKTLPELGIAAMQCHLEQAPAPANGHTAIISAVVADNADHYFSSIGVATPEAVNGSTDPQRLLDEAQKRALSRAIRLIAFSQDPIASAAVTQPVAPAIPALTERLPSKPRQGRHCTHPGSITTKQTELLRTIAAERGSTAEQYAQEICGKRLSDLSSKDANTIIKKIKCA